MKKRRIFSGLAFVAGTALALGATQARADRDNHDDQGNHKGDLQWVKHLVVIYMENHSFDNLYGKWEPVNGTPVNGLSNADSAHTLQVAEGGGAYECLLQDEPNLISPSPLPGTCVNTTGKSFSSAFVNAPFATDSYIPTTSLTRDLVHRFYQEQYQLNGGRQNRYVTGSDAVGLSMGYYDTTKLPVYAYLHSKNAPAYVVLDNFFQGAFGGSFLNHQWLVSAQAPIFSGAANDGSSVDLHSVVDANGMPNNYPLYVSPLGTQVKDKALTTSCSPPSGRPATPADVVCGDYAINTIQPLSQPYAPGTTVANRLPPLTSTNIGDSLSSAGIDWAWYSGGWSNAAGNVGEPGWTNGTAPLPANPTSTAPCLDSNSIPAAVWPNCPDTLFQFHHQAFNYFAAYAEGMPARKQHLRDEVEFEAAARKGQLKAVSFVKPIGEENEHPGYASVDAGSKHLRDLLQAIDSGRDADNTLVVVTYDEFGGAWDHVPPPGQGGRPGVHDKFGPGTRVPALLVSRHFDRSAVDHTQYDTTSILSTIEHRFGLAPVGEVYSAGTCARPRDAAVKDFSNAARATRD
jgi:acid phosphatase